MVRKKTKRSTPVKAGCECPSDQASPGSPPAGSSPFATLVTRESLADKSHSGLTPLVKQLAAKLLDMGGEKVFWRGEERYAEQLLSRGQLFTGKVRMKPGQAQKCHMNAAKLWAEDIEGFKLVTGYAFTLGVWVQHIWVVKGEEIYETTVKF